MTVRKLSRYGFILRTAARQQWVYRGELGIQTISMIVFMGIFMALWTTAYGVSGKAELAGYSLAQVVWYLGMTESIALSSSRIFNEIGAAVRAGDLAYTLSRPLSYPFYQVANSLGNSVPRFLVNFLTAIAVVGIGIGQFAGSPQGIAAFLVMAMLALLLDALIAVLIGLAAFWLEEVNPVFLIYQKLLFTVGGMFLPLEMFPGWLRRIATWMPFQFITYAPPRAFVDFEPEFVMQALVGQVIYVVVLAALVSLVWRIAQRRMVVHGG
ncbi:MAG: ABC transporter permease [Anaerolineae bacterium]|jgi:ABC-2 type transport system permease protein